MDSFDREGNRFTWCSPWSHILWPLSFGFIASMKTSVVLRVCVDNLILLFLQPWRNGYEFARVLRPRGAAWSYFIQELAILAYVLICTYVTHIVYFCWSILESVTGSVDKSHANKTSKWNATRLSVFSISASAKATFDCFLFLFFFYSQILRGIILRA